MLGRLWDVFDREIDFLQRDSPTSQHVGCVLHVIEVVHY